MKIYISGAITGVSPLDAKNNFESAAIILRDMGHEPINPMEIGLDESGDHTWAEYMLADMPFVFEADAIFMLENWQQSKGARIERYIFEVMEKPIFYQASNIIRLLV